MGVWLKAGSVRAIAAARSMGVRSIVWKASLDSGNAGVLRIRDGVAGRRRVLRGRR
jgi:hypothetical protein